MILFQCLALPVLGLLLAVELFRRFTGRERGPAIWLRFALWLAAFVAICWPNLMTRIAGIIGVTRGADLVSYVFALAFLGTTFYFYSSHVRLRRQVTQIVRHLAVENPRRGSDRRGVPTANPDR